MPSPAVLADEGVKAVKAGKYSEGISKLTEALKERPAPLWLLERSKAHLRTGDLSRALHDAERALRVAFDRGAARDLMVEAQIRRAVTYFRLKRYADADVCAFWAIRLCEGARASEDDGQLRKVDPESGDYAVTCNEVTEASAAEKKESGGKQGGLAAAMGGGAGRTKETQLKNQAFSWRLQALTQLDKLPAGDPGRKVGITEKYPNPPKELPAEEAEEDPSSASSDAAEVNDGGDRPLGNTTNLGEGGEAARKAAWEELWGQFRAAQAKKDIRSSYYQTDSTLNVDFFVKNVPKESFKVDAQADKVVLSSIPNARNGQIHLFLYGKIKPEETKYTVKSMKIELVLKKDTPGKWPALRKQNSELVDNLALASFPAPSFNQFYKFVASLGYQYPEDLHIGEQTESYDGIIEKLQAGLESTSTTEGNTEVASSKPVTIDAASTKTTAEPSTSAPVAGQINKSNPPAAGDKGSSLPVYPTSSKTGPKDWDKIDVDDDENDGGEKEGDVNSFFQSLYKNADDDTRRAMMKSYVESNGTSLSTSWSEAQAKTYETQPPDGSEVKKW